MTDLVPVDPEIFIDPAADLSPIASSRLFYPCSGDDLQTALALFANRLDEFEFVDLNYFTPRRRDQRHAGRAGPVEEPAPIPAPSREWKLVSSSGLSRPFVHAWPEPDWEIPRPPQLGYGLDPRLHVEPAIVELVETYQHRASGHRFQVVRRNGNARQRFRSTANRPLGVFFYRGDSQGEGGSNILWNVQPMFGEVLDRLVDGGLFVTDGSNHGFHHNRHYRQHQLMFATSDLGQDQAWKHAIGRSFRTDAGRRFTCIGYAGRRYGATLIWQVWRT